MPACRIDRSIYPSRPVTLARASVCIHPPILGPRPPSIDVSLPYPHPTTQPTTPHTTTAPPPPSPSAGRRSWPRTPAQSRPCRRASGTALRRSFPGTSSTTTSGCVRFRLCGCVWGQSLGSIDRSTGPARGCRRPTARQKSMDGGDSQNTLQPPTPTTHKHISTPPSTTWRRTGASRTGPPGRPASGTSSSPTASPRR